MGWSATLAVVTSGDPAEAFGPGLATDADRAAALVRTLYPAATVTESGETVLDFALSPYDDEVFAGWYGRALLVCDQRLFQMGEESDRVAAVLASALPDARCGVLVLHSVVAGCWFRYFVTGELRREVLVTVEDGVVLDTGPRLPVEEPYWKAIDAGAADVPLPFDQEDFGLDLARTHLFGRAITERGEDGFMPLELPLRRYKLR